MLIHSILLGITQGITEFLPISSSAHLVILPYLFHWPWQGLVFDVALHFGTFLAILIFFWKDIVQIISAVIARSPRRSNLDIRKIATPSGLAMTKSNLAMKQWNPNLLWMILLATVPGAIAGALLEKEAETFFRNPLLIAINLLVFGIIIWLVDKKPDQKSKIKNQNYNLKVKNNNETMEQWNNDSISSITYKKALLVGLAQMLAIVPGVSRSGSTMAMGRAIGLNRPDAARFSFLLAAPIMFGSAVFEVRHFSSSMITLNFIAAFIASLIFGLLAIKYLLKYLERGNFAVFTWYRAVIALIVIVVYILRLS